MTKSFVKDCHKGNTLVYKEPRGGSLYIGGWNNGATFDYNTHVIDLTGTEHRYWDVAVPFDEESKKFMPFLMQAYAGWLSLPFPDYQTPKGLNTRAQWEGIAKTIKDILQKGNDVLVACLGGHGRSGLFCSIVGYLLNINTDRSWSSPVEKIRKIHCDDAVETIAQEKFVYDILGLNITIKHSYINNDDDMNWGGYGTSLYTYKKCPICGTQSMYVTSNGMCLGCQEKYKDAPVRSDLTLEDIKYKGMVDHACDHPKCMGIWKAKECGHVTHDMIIYEGYCETCAQKRETEQRYVDQHEDPCVICEKSTGYSSNYGICYDCSVKLGTSEDIDAVHNSITDPYRAFPHHCEDVSCVGIVMADVCGHIIHNREVTDGLCPMCFDEKKARNEGK